MEYINQRVDESLIAFRKLKEIRGDSDTMDEVWIGWPIPTGMAIKVNVDGGSAELQCESWCWSLRS